MENTTTATTATTANELARTICFRNASFQLPSMASCMRVFEEKRDHLGYGPTLLFKEQSRKQSIDEVESLLALDDWLYHCLKIKDVNLSDSLICLAANFDGFPGIIAVVLETAMDPGSLTHNLLIKGNEWVAFMDKVVEKNYIEIVNMAISWGVGINHEKLAEIPLAKTRKHWREECGYDVLINPVTLKPCEDLYGNILNFKGLDVLNERDIFVFENSVTGKKVVSEDLTVYFILR